MELSYITDWPKSDSNVCVKKLIGDSVCSWSCHNTVAFTAVGNAEGLEEREMNQPRIHIVDPDRAWELHSITNGHKDTIQVLQWDSGGTRLLSADVSGTVMMWCMKQYLMNDWECKAESYISGDPIVAVAWLHNGIKISYNVDSMDSNNMLEKFCRTRYSASLSHQSARSANGWVAVTATGLISVTEIQDGGKIHTVTECLGSTRAHAAMADIAYTSNGDILVATSDGSCRSPMMVYKVKLQWKNNDQISIISEYLPSMHLQCCSDINNRDKYTSITHLRFVNKECSESQGAVLPTEQLIVCATGPSGSCVECWSLHREAIPLHKMFQTSQPNRDNIPHRQKWSCVSSFNDASPVTAIALPKLPVKLSNTSIYNGPGMFFALAYQDGSIKLLHRISLKPCAAFKYEGVKGDTGPQAKRQKLYNGKNLVYMEMSSTCCSIVGLDRRGALCLIKIAPTLGQALDQGAARAHTIAQVVNLLEYCMVTGYDWWDLLLTISPGMVDAVIDRLTEAFNRQSKSTQELLFTRLVAIKACLYRLSTGGGGKSVDCYCRLLLLAIATVFRSLLRPTSLTQDKGPAEKLTALCTHSSETDLDKVMMNLDTKEFVLEPTTLQSLQHLIQFIADYSLSVLTTVPIQSIHSIKPGLSVLKDHLTLCLLRELLVIIRIWGLLNKSCLPVFSTTSDSLDSLSLLFKLLTQVWMTCKDDSASELDDSIVDECCLLPSQIMMQTLDVTPVTEGIMGKLHSRHTMSFEFDNNPIPFISIATFNPQLGMSLGTEVNVRSLTDKIHQKSDIVRRLYLGTSPPEPLRRCTRCSCISLLHSPARTTPMKYWEQRWARSCLCGGLWRKVALES